MKSFLHLQRNSQHLKYHHEHLKGFLRTDLTQQGTKIA